MPGAVAAGRLLQLVPRQPTGALPITAFALAAVGTPEIEFATDLPFDLVLGALRLRGAGGEPVVGGPVLPSPRTPPSTLPIETIVARLAGHITHVDHTGVNLPSAQVDDERWEGLVHGLARVAALYRYPDGEPWPFILPTSDEEFAGEIRSFVAGRTPRFELVYDALATAPIIQIALGTDLTRAELEDRFPAPYGVAFPGLGEYFRTVYLEQPWSDLWLRLDLYYSSADAASAWDSGRWLVEAGGRIR